MDVSDIRHRWTVESNMQPINDLATVGVVLHETGGLQGTCHPLSLKRNYFDDVREEKQRHQETRKRKSKKTLTADTPTSKHRACSSGDGTQVAVAVALETRLDGTSDGRLDVESREEEGESHLSDGEGHHAVVGADEVAGGDNGLGK
jgi:hypothetical protein